MPESDISEVPAANLLTVACAAACADCSACGSACADIYSSFRLVGSQGVDNGRLGGWAPGRDT